LVPDRLEELSSLAAETINAINAASAPDALAQLKSRALGPKGYIKDALTAIKEVPADARKEYGQRVNALKQELEQRFAQREAELASGAKAAQEFLDDSLPGTRVQMGRLHPVQSAMRRIIGIFTSMGFDVYAGPEMELEEYNFDKLNIPAYHPARDDVDTYFLAPNLVLRTHTSPVQVRVMERIKERGEVVVQMISPGRTFRRDRPDATHTPAFHQLEGLQIGKGISMANMRWILSEYARQFFGPETKVRLRPDYFPFVEPGAELAVTCPFCAGAGCRVCKQSGWIEVLGCGMVHPQVLRNSGIDPEVYSGWAFGFGVERMAQVLYQVPDARMFFDNDLRFLRQFS
jgi:phenylalanyl-tRNA synthetase alpha chain